MEDLILPKRLFPPPGSRLFDNPRLENKAEDAWEWDNKRRQKCLLLLKTPAANLCATRGAYTDDKYDAHNGPEPAES